MAGAKKQLRIEGCSTTKVVLCTLDESLLKLLTNEPVGAISAKVHLCFELCGVIILRNCSSVYSTLILFILSVGV